MRQYEVEVLLRPAIEFRSAIAAFLLAAIAFVSPQSLLLTNETIANFATLGFLLFGLAEANDGFRILRYRWGMRRLPRYRLSLDRIPVSRKHFFVGRGFLWDQRHTQRLMDSRADNEFTAPNVVTEMARRLEYRLEGVSLLRVFSHLLGHPSALNPFRPPPPVGGSPQIHAVGMWEGEKDLQLSLSERVGHMLVLGTTRVGKTRFAEMIIDQDIRRGDVVICFDPKGDADLMRRVYGTAKACNRPVYLMHLGYPEISCRYNAAGEFGRITEVASRITSSLPSDGDSAAFKEFAWRFVNIIANALYALGRKPGYLEIRRYILNIEPLLSEYSKAFLRGHVGPDGLAEISERSTNIDTRQLSFAKKDKDTWLLAMTDYVRDHQIYDPILEGLTSAFEYDKSYFDKIVASLGPLLEKLTTGKMLELLAPDYDDLTDNRTILDWNRIVRENAVVYVGLDALSDSVVASAVGASMFADLTSVAGRLYKHGDTAETPTSLGDRERRVSVHADEFNELIGEEFIPLLNKAGGAGFQVTAYTQTWSDVEARLGNRAKAGQVLGNFNTVFALRLKEPRTAEIVTDQLPEVRVSITTAVSGVQDHLGMNYHSNNQDRVTKERVAMLAPGDLLRLPKGQAFALVEGGHLFKLLLPEPLSEPHLPENLEAIASDMQLRYRQASDDWFYEGRWWIGDVA